MRRSGGRFNERQFHPLLLLLMRGCRQSPQPVPTPVPPIDPATNPVLMPSIEALKETWNVLLPGEETACALGEPFGFFVRPADSERLLIYFQGGGACWNGLTCLPGETATCDLNVTRDDNPCWTGSFRALPPRSRYS